MMSSIRYPLWAHAVFLNPARVESNLHRAQRSGMVERAPNLWQLALGVGRMLHRFATRPSSVGLSADHAAPVSWRARLLANRGLRFPFVLAKGAVAPWDLSGLHSSPARMIRHLTGTHHDHKQFVYDLQILACHPGALERLRDETQAIVDGVHPEATALRDLCVYEGYHESLLAGVEDAIAGEWGLNDEEAQDPDVSFEAYLTWCADQPATPAETYAAWRAGRFGFGGGDPPASPRSGAGAPAPSSEVA